MNKMNWIAEGAKVYMQDQGKRTLFCTLSSELLTPNVAAQETAAALNDKFSN